AKVGNQGDGGGRPPTVLTEEQIAQVEALGAVLSIEQIADYFGISKPTFYAIMERQPDVSLRYKRGKAKAIGKVSQGLIQKAMAGDNAAAIFYLKTQAGWKETQHVQQEVKEVKSFSDMYGK
ncbi:homeodomain-like protein, partial [Vibrio phage 1.213.O._10N.222.54.F10]